MFFFHFEKKKNQFYLTKTLKFWIEKTNFDWSCFLSDLIIKMGRSQKQSISNYWATDRKFFTNRSEIQYQVDTSISVDQQSVSRSIALLCWTWLTANRATLELCLDNKDVQFSIHHSEKTNPVQEMTDSLHFKIFGE